MLRRSTVRALFPPLEAAASAAVAADEAAHANGGAGDVNAALMTVYQDADAHAGLYNYAKALEAAEAGLLDYFYQHFRLAGAGRTSRTALNDARTAQSSTTWSVASVSNRAELDGRVCELECIAYQTCKSVGHPWGA